MDLSKKDRLIIANQLKILEKLYPEEADDYVKHRMAIENGYKLHYSWLLAHLSDEMSEEDCREVLDILNMYRALKFSYKELDDKSGIDEKKIRFAGFDGNMEGNQYYYTNYFIIDLDRFNELRDGSEYPDFNSHHPMLEKYKKMLGVWNGFQDEDKFHLDKERIERVLRA